jgi:hypothetical protein
MEFKSSITEKRQAGATRFDQKLGRARGAAEEGPEDNKGASLTLKPIYPR